MASGDNIGKFESARRRCQACTRSYNASVRFGHGAPTAEQLVARHGCTIEEARYIVRTGGLSKCDSDSVRPPQKKNKVASRFPRGYDHPGVRYIELTPENFPATGWGLGVNPVHTPESRRVLFESILQFIWPFPSTTNRTAVIRRP